MNEETKKKLRNKLTGMLIINSDMPNLVQDIAEVIRIIDESLEE